MKPDTVINILNDVTNFNFGMFGIAITVFTVLYAFIMSRKDSLRTLNDLVINGEDSPLIKQRISFFFDDTLNWKNLNKQLKKIIVFTFLLYLAGIITKYFCKENENTVNIAYTIIVLSFIDACYIVKIMYLVVRNYNKYAK